MRKLLGVAILVVVLALVLWFFMGKGSDSGLGVKDESNPPAVQETVTVPPQEEKKELLLEIHPLPSEDKSRFDADLITLGEETYRIGADEPESQVLQVCQTIVEELQKREVQSIDVPTGGTQRVRQRLIKELKKNGITVRDLEDLDTDAGTGTGAGTDAGVDANTGSNAAAGTEASATAGADANAATGAGASAEANAGSSTDAGASTGTDASTEQNQK